MKKFAMLCALLAAGAMLFAGGNKEEAKGDQSLQKVLDAKKFVLGLDDSFPPMGFRDENNEIVGFDIDVAREVCSRLGVELVPQPIDWNSKEQELNTGKIDCIWNGFTMNGREDDYEFSVPYVNNSQVIATSEDSGISSLADLAGKTVGVQADSAALSLLSEGGDQADLAATFGDLQQFADYNTAFAELMAGSLDAVAIDIGVAQYQINGREGYKILDEYLNAEQYAVGFKKGNTVLRDKINADLKTLLDNGTFDEIAGKYAGNGVDPTMLCLAESFGEASTEAETEA